MSSLLSERLVLIVFSTFPNGKSTAFRARSSVSLKKHIEQQLALPAIFHFFCCPDLLGLYQCLQFFNLVFIYVYLCLLVFTDLFLQMFTNVNKCSAAVKCHDYPGEVYSSSYT